MTGSQWTIQKENTEEKNAQKDVNEIVNWYNFHIHKHVKKKPDEPFEIQMPPKKRITAAFWRIMFSDFLDRLQLEYSIDQYNTMKVLPKGTGKFLSGDSHNTVPEEVHTHRVNRIINYYYALTDYEKTKFLEEIKVRK